MILTLDIGNTNIKTALFEGEEMVNYWRISTDRSKSSDEYGMILASLFQHNHREMSQVEGIVMSSVVPSINFTIEHMCRNYFGMDPMMVAPGIKTGINIKYENPRELGSDRIANAVAAYTLYGGPLYRFRYRHHLRRHVGPGRVSGRRHLPGAQVGRRGVGGTHR